MTLPPISGEVGLDTTDFKTAIASMNRELRVIESGFRASAAALGDWTHSATGLENRAETLTEKLEIQGRKVEALRGEYERVAEEKGENSRAAQQLDQAKQRNGNFEQNGGGAQADGKGAGGFGG